MFSDEKQHRNTDISKINCNAFIEASAMFTNLTQRVSSTSLDRINEEKPNPPIEAAEKGKKNYFIIKVI